MALQPSAGHSISKGAYAALDLSAENIWPSQRVVDIDGWRCRIDRGVTRRANSVLALGEAGDAKLDEVVQTYHSYRLRPVFQVTPAAGGAALDNFLKGRGYTQEGSSIVMRLSIDSLKHNEEQGEDLRFSPELTPSWLHAYGLDQDDRAVKVKEAILERIKTRTIFAAIGREDELRAVGLGLLDGELGWINCMHTLRGYRRQGLGRQIIAGLCKRLCDLGASAIHLQVESDNVGARELYGSHGFEEIYRYHYRVGAQPDASKVIGV